MKLQDYNFKLVCVAILFYSLNDPKSQLPVHDQRQHNCNHIISTEFYLMKSVNNRTQIISAYLFLCQRGHVCLHKFLT